MYIFLEYKTEARSHRGMKLEQKETKATKKGAVVTKGDPKKQAAI
jgi:hypothetical protein